MVILPAGGRNLEAAARLLAWMMSPEIVAEGTYANATLPTSRRAARDARFQQLPNWSVFMDLLAHPNAGPALNPPHDPPGGG